MIKKVPALGAIYSPEDYRDRVASAVPGVALTLPQQFDTTLGPVQMQAKEPACVSHSVVEIMKLYWFIKTGKWIDFSPRFLDILAKRYDGQPIDGGTIPRLVLKLAAKYGCATTATLPSDTTLPILDYRNDAVITQKVMDEAAQYKIPGYIRVSTDIQSMRQAIYIYGAVSALFSIGNELWTPSWTDKDIDPLRTPRTIVGGHQMTPKGWYGYRLNTLRNEWSDAWANKGEACYDAQDWAPFTHEAWAIAEIPKNVTALLANLPASEDFHYEWKNNLALGARNEDVKFAQIALMILGHLEKINPADLGIYGPKTAAAVAKYQASKGIFPLAPNNIGPRTRDRLNLDFSI